MGRVIELRWDCNSCGSMGVLGRHKVCPSCGSPREQGEMRMDGLDDDKDGDGYNDAASVEDPALLELANAGFDWFCPHCRSGNRGDGRECSACGASRDGRPDGAEDVPSRAVPTRKAEDDFFRKQAPPPEDWAPEAPPPDRSRWIFGGAGVLFLVFVLTVGWWASRTHDVVGAVARMEWSRTVTVEAWTPEVKREWAHRAQERVETPPVNGAGERSGFIRVPDSCREEHYDDETYQCGTREESYDCSTYHTESYTDTCYRTESYRCGETCRDQGNGFARCSPKTCTRQQSYSCTKTRRVRDPKTCRREVPRYCERPIYRERCGYLTQKWVGVRTPTLSGTGRDLTWPDPALGPLERSSRGGQYTVTWSYEDDGKPNSFSRGLPEAEYLSWTDGQQVYLKVTRMGTVSDFSPTPIPD